MYQFNSRVRFSETDANQTMTLYAILNYFQDCSIFHSEQAGLGITALTEQGYAWILSSWQTVIDRYPKLGEEISVSTWAYGFKGFYGYRNFCIRDAAGKDAAYANTIWTLMDIHTGMPVKIPGYMADLYGLEDPYPMENAPRKIRSPAEGISMEPRTVHKFQIDTNQHMNNAQYVLMAQEYLPPNSVIRQMRADYRQAARLNDLIHPVVTVSGSQTTVVLNNKEQDPYAIIEFIRR